MQRNALRLLVALITFAVGVGAAVAWFYFPRLHRPGLRNDKPSSESSQFTTKPEVPFVAFCDLARNPALYDRRVIRTKAILSVGTDTRTLWASECEGSYISGECFHPPEQTCEGLSAAIDKFRGGEKGGWMDAQTAVDVTGQFSAHGENGRGYELELLEVKDAKAVSARR